MLLISQFHFLCRNRNLKIIRTAALAQIKTPPFQKNTEVYVYFV